MDKSVLGLVIVAGIVITFIAATLGGGGGNTPVSWNSDNPLAAGTYDGIYFNNAIINSEAEETYTFNDCFGVVSWNLSTADTTIVMNTGGMLTLAVGSSVTSGELDITLDPDAQLISNTGVIDEGITIIGGD